MPANRTGCVGRTFVHWLLRISNSRGRIVVCLWHFVNENLQRCADPRTASLLRRCDSNTICDRRVPHMQPVDRAGGDSPAARRIKLTRAYFCGKLKSIRVAQEKLRASHARGHGTLVRRNEIAAPVADRTECSDAPTTQPASGLRQVKAGPRRRYNVPCSACLQPAWRSKSNVDRIRDAVPPCVDRLPP